ncbi:MarR family winged helix-turn-helix transcriptional regulator [Streptantibioticus cattleyicolor]|uniref:Regulatory protein n=1 Tax=Streptantibioticus cattleyicolor (strain ATCC 35852 / DSM 46488 / JCM 4925 / NBRC 14057 / NRRL 8057) TaxID=1003195 RepID=F8JN29_STREN|nr:MarR family transcriptional regulator [Streptantibioticus cattleyicolor]AEW99220.1 regulatory protein [Streptantibioticus cattleyicolor NRRL 8057 = DSM 46488]CCB71737.1 transcriptional regulator sensing organic peroxides [Streptantibioticus cattleyicolor NRRL 8057 = DSM 46488]
MSGTAAHQESAPDLLRLDVQICFALHSAARAFGGVYRQLLRETGLTYPQYLAMMALWEHGEMPVKRLGELLRLDSGTLSPLLKRLDAAGLVRRDRSPEDERSVIVTLTAAGRALREKAAPVPLAVARTTGLTVREAVELRDTLERVTDALDAAARAGVAVDDDTPAVCGD